MASTTLDFRREARRCREREALCRRHKAREKAFAAEYEPIEEKKRQLRQEAHCGRSRYRKEFKEAAELPLYLRKQWEFREAGREITEPDGRKRRSGDDRRLARRPGRRYGYRRHRPRGP